MKKKVEAVLLSTFISLMAVNILLELMRFYVDGKFFVEEIVSKLLTQAVALLVVWFSFRNTK